MLERQPGNRVIDHFCYLLQDTPKWLLPDLKRILNERGGNLGDTLKGYSPNIKYPYLKELKESP